MARTRLSETDFRDKNPRKTKEDRDREVKRRGTHLPLIGFVDGLSREQSLYSLLFCAAAIDRKLHADEITEVNALAVRTHTLGKVSTKKLQKMQEVIEPHLQDEVKVLKLAEKASRVYRYDSKKRAASAFMHTLDILFADRDLTEAEKNFIKRLAHFLNIPAKDASQYVDVLMTKNEH